MAVDSQDTGAKRWRGMPRRAVLLIALAAAVVGAVLWVRSGQGPSGSPSESSLADAEESERWRVWSEAEEQWRDMERVEDLIITLTPLAASLADSVLNLELPDLPKRAIFGVAVVYRDLAAPDPEARNDLATLGIERRGWRVSETEGSGSPSDLQLWRAFFDQVLYFDHAAFKLADGAFPAGARHDFDSELHFSGGARLRSGAQVAVEARSRVRWHDEAGELKGEEPDWRIVGWQTERFELLEAASPLFEEVLGSALVDRRDLRRARDSIHERHVIDYILNREKFSPPTPYFTVPSEDFHPGISIVDLDRDGFDDFYVMARWGPNMFFHNRGDGSFEEIAGEIGLDIENHSTSAIFADFDNDGDADLALGRSLERSMILFNESGRFVEPASQVASEPLPYFTTSVSSVDYDGDGLLDLYLSTYMKVLMVREFIQKRGRIEEGMLADFLPLLDAQRLAQLRLAPDFQQYLNHPGPPNMLLRNLGGGRFKVVNDVPALRIFRNTFQSTWGDYDGDGDPDVYVANDFGPNNLVRNDGQGRFTDITEQSQTADIGFGMGASWGDYDNDGESDLYVSNMYSTAGNRILKRLDHVDGTFLGAARGNTLFRNAQPSFDKVSGIEAPALTVEKAGWSWGGQFADLDNSGFEDIYTLSGYYTAAKEVAIDRDT